MSLTDITKYFHRNSKRQDLCGNSNLEEDAKKLSEGILILVEATILPMKCLPRVSNRLIVEANEGMPD